MATLTHILFATFAIVLLQGNFVVAHRKLNVTYIESPAASTDQQIKDIHNTNKDLDLIKDSAVKEKTNHNQGLETIEQLSGPTQRVRRSGDKSIWGEWMRVYGRGKRSADFLPRARREVIDQGNRVVVDRSKKVIKRSPDCDVIHQANELAAEEAKENTEEQYQIDLRSSFASKANHGKRSPNIFESVEAAKRNNNVSKYDMDPTKRRGKRSPNVSPSVQAAMDSASKHFRGRGKRSPNVLESVQAAMNIVGKHATDQARRGKRSPNVSPSVQAAMDSASKHFRGRGKRSLDSFPPMRSPHFVSTVLSEMENDLKQVHKDIKRDERFANELSTVNDMSLVGDSKWSEDENSNKRFRRSPNWVASMKEAMEKVKRRVNQGKRSADVTSSMNSSSDEHTSFSDERNIATLRKRRSPINLPPNISEILIKAARDHANRKG